VLALAATGCADDVSPAARVGDITITHDELMAEVEQWARSPRLVELVTQGQAAGGSGRFNTALVTVVLQNRIALEVYRSELEERGLEVDQVVVSRLRTQLFQSPADTAQVLDELDAGFAEELLDDIAAQITLQSELGDGATEFVRTAFADVEVSPRYGSWDAGSGFVVPPEGPREAPSDEDDLLQV
jgi:hypothetical protein